MNQSGGWNRPTGSGQERATRKRPSLWRGALAGLAVVAAAAGGLFLAVPKSGGGKAGETAGRMPLATVAARAPQAAKTIAAEKPVKPLAVPKISQERIERREAVQAPQPLEEMRMATTNAPAKRPARAFRNSAEQLIAMATPSSPGTPVPPLPEITDEGEAMAVAKALKHVIAAEEGDTEAVLEKKAVVAESKEELRELMTKEGWTFVEYVKALRDRANLDAEVLADAHKICEDLYHDKAVSDADYLKYVEQVNEKLKERGLPEIKTGENDENE